MRDARSGIPNRKSLALIGSASTQSAECGPDVEAEALSITRLEGSRWRGGRLWSWNGDRRACDVAHVTVGAGAAMGLIRFRGHLLEGGYDVDHGGSKAETDSAQVHG